ncbi:MAG: hypothetical protein JXR77_12600 [Lentisphaeria bacterium]|nr:hypothetical protein [Lentisphaeria bacterium]
MCAVLLAGIGAAGVFDLPVGAEPGMDVPYMQRNAGAQERPGARFVDGNAHLTYAFATAGLSRLALRLSLANNFRVQVSTDGRSWKEVLNAMAIHGRDRHDGELGEYAVDASPFLPAEAVFVRFRDASVLDGWGAYLTRIRIESDAPDTHAWTWRGPPRTLPGLVEEWLVFGSFPASRRDALLAAALPPGVVAESLLPPAEGSWRAVGARGGRVDLRQAMPASAPREDCLAFAHVFAWSPGIRDVRLLLGSDDALAVYVNGASRLRREVLRGCRDGDEDIPVRLGPGWNRILLAVGNGAAAWEFTCRLVGQQGESLPEIRLQAANPLPDLQPFPVPEVPPAATLTRADLAPRRAYLDGTSLRLPIRLEWTNPGGPLRTPQAVALLADGVVLERWVWGEVPAGASEGTLTPATATWVDWLEGPAVPLDIAVGERRLPLGVAPLPLVLGELADALAEAGEGGAELASVLGPLAEVQRAWNAGFGSAVEQQEGPRRRLAAVLRGDGASLRRESENLAAAGAGEPWRTSFQCAAPYDPRFDVQCDAVLVYGLGDTERRVRRWRRQGYQANLMTGIAWGQYQDYLYGRFDGTPHLDDAQMDREGNRVSHGGDVYYMVPTESYTRYLCRFIEQSFAVPLDGICLEEPEFWMRSGWSPAFRREWEAYFREPWEAPDSSHDACYRAGKLRRELYSRCLRTVCDFVKSRRPSWQCIVATHSLINYANWGIASPESALADIESCDAVIAQVWTDTILTPCPYDGRSGSQPFAMAYLEFAQMTGMITPTGKELAFLADPVSDDSRRQWDTYRRCYEHTVAAGLIAGGTTRFEVMPWPDRVFCRAYALEGDDGDEREVGMPSGYATSLLATVNALRAIPGDEEAPWLGLLVADSLMFQRGAVRGRAEGFDDLYGLALPCLRAGMRPGFVQMEHLLKATLPASTAVLLLTYNGQKPPSPSTHAALAGWVRNGGTLLFFCDGLDPFADVPEWWNEDGTTRKKPEEHLLAEMGLDGASPGWHPVAGGWLCYQRLRPAEFCRAGGPQRLEALLREACRRGGRIEFPGRQRWVSRRRGPYLIASNMSEGEGSGGVEGGRFVCPGTFVDLFGDGLPLVDRAECAPGRSGLWLDVERLPAEPGVCASASRMTGWVRDKRSAAWVSRGPLDTPAVTWVRLPGPPASVAGALHDSRPAAVTWRWEGSAGLLRLEHANAPDGVWLRVGW